MMFELVKKFFVEEEGQGLVEYALILALIAIVVIGAVSLIGTNARDMFDQIAASL